MTAAEKINYDEARLFEYDLGNLAREHWFKPEERWELAVVNAKQQNAIVKNYQPVLFIAGTPKDIYMIRDFILNGMQLKNTTVNDSEITDRDTVVWLIAYNPERMRK